MRSHHTSTRSGSGPILSDSDTLKHHPPKEGTGRGSGFVGRAWLGGEGPLCLKPLTIGVLLLVGACDLLGPDRDPTVRFADPALEAAVRGTIGLPEGPIHASDLEELTVLPAEGQGISDLTGLEHAVHLEELDVGRNRISDLSPLGGLVRLRSLDVWGNELSDLSPLDGLRSLEELEGYSNQVSDLSPLSDLERLKVLRLRDNQISDLSPLEGLRDSASADSLAWGRPCSERSSAYSGTGSRERCPDRSLAGKPRTQFRPGI